MSNTPSLAHFLEAERRAAASVYRRNQNHSPKIYGPSDFSPIMPVLETNTLFVGGQVAPQSSAPLGESGGRKSDNELFDSNGYGIPFLFSCLRGHLIKSWLWYLDEHYYMYLSSGSLDFFDELRVRLHLFKRKIPTLLRRVFFFYYIRRWELRQAATLKNYSALICF